jgi:hypothetical protein
MNNRRILNQSRGEPSVIALEELLDTMLEEVKNKLLTCYDEKAVIRLQGSGEAYRRLIDMVKHADLQVDK